MTRNLHLVQVVRSYAFPSLTCSRCNLHEMQVVDKLMQSVVSGKTSALVARDERTRTERPFVGGGDGEQRRFLVATADKLESDR